MGTTTGQNRAEQIEDIFDSIGNMTDFASMLSAICAEKAEHVRSSWQDQALGACWDRWAKAFDAASARLPDPYGN